MDVSYIAHSERCALLLDADGICLWVVPKVGADDATVAAARRCVGAQYVAALDRDAPGFMGHEPRAGTSLLFALVTDGRVALVRFGPLQAFEKLDAPRAAPGATDRESASARTAPGATARESAAAVTAPSPGHEAEPRPSHADVAPEAAASEPLPPTVADFPDLEDVIASFSPDPVADAAPAAARADAAPALEPLVVIDPIAFEPEPAAAEPRATARSLDHAAEAEPALAPPAPGPDDADPEIALRLETSGELDVVTTAFARSERFVAMLKSASDLELDTGAFSRADRRDGDAEPFVTEAEREPLRPSGFVMRRARELVVPDAPPARAQAEVETFATDDETRRFSRAAGDVPFEELDAPDRAAPPRRGMLPRR